MNITKPLPRYSIADSVDSFPSPTGGYHRLHFDLKAGDIAGSVHCNGRYTEVTGEKARQAAQAAAHERERKRIMVRLLGTYY